MDRSPLALPSESVDEGPKRSHCELGRHRAERPTASRAAAQRYRTFARWRRGGGRGLHEDGVASLVAGRVVDADGLEPIEVKDSKASDIDA
jgi:hypothetical protein